MAQEFAEESMATNEEAYGTPGTFISDMPSAQRDPGRSPALASRELVAPELASTELVSQALASPETERHLGEIADWLKTLETSPRVSQPPSTEDKKHLGELLLGLWQASDAHHPTGLERHSPAQRRFQDVLGDYFWQSPIIRRCFAKPRGYAGDFLMMEDIYRGEARGETPLGRWMDQWILEQPGFVAVRNRRAKMVSLLNNEQKRGARHVMNIAAGSASELLDVTFIREFEKITLLDQDAGALMAASNALKGRVDPSALITCYNSVRSLLRGKPTPEHARQDVIYSIGMYDYISTRLATALTARLWRKLAPGGLLAIGNFNGHSPMRRFIEAAMDWYLIYRDPPDLMALIEDLPAIEQAEVWTDPKDCLHMLLVRKQGARHEAP